MIGYGILPNKIDKSQLLTQQDEIFMVFHMTKMIGWKVLASHNIIKVGYGFSRNKYEQFWILIEQKR